MQPIDYIGITVICIFGLMVLYLTVPVIVKALGNWILRKYFGYFKSVVYGEPNRIYWRRSYTKEFHWDFTNPHYCYNGPIKFGTYYSKWANGYHSCDSLTKPIPEKWEEHE